MNQFAAEFPHCNTDTIHDLGVCYYCDQYPHLQGLRVASGRPFTPPEANGWSGNVAVREGEIHNHMGASYVVGSATSSKPLMRRIRSWFGATR